MASEPLKIKKRGEDGIASMIQLAIDLSDKGEYDKFIQIFSEDYYNPG